VPKWECRRADESWKLAASQRKKKHPHASVFAYVWEWLDYYVLDLPESSLRYGLLEKTELRFSVPDYFQSLSGAPASSGFGDLALGVK